MEQEGDRVVNHNHRAVVYQLPGRLCRRLPAGLNRATACNSHTIGSSLGTAPRLQPCDVRHQNSIRELSSSSRSTSAPAGSHDMPPPPRGLLDHITPRHLLCLPLPHPGFWLAGVCRCEGGGFVVCVYVWCVWSVQVSLYMRVGSVCVQVCKGMRCDEI